jgi:hypothetical protein
VRTDKTLFALNAGDVTITYTRQLRSDDYLDNALLDVLMVDIRANARGRLGDRVGRVYVCVHAVIVVAVGTPVCNAKTVALLAAAKRANMLSSDYVVVVRTHVSI